MIRGESVSGQVCNPVTELFVARRDKAAPIAVKGMADGESGVEDVAVMREFWGLEAIA